MKVVVVPDIHLKPWIVDQAEKVLRDGKAEQAVFLGDYVDDWNQQSNTELYRSTLQSLLDFAEKHPETKFCIGNHDFQYLKGIKGAGYSTQQLNLVRNFFGRIHDVAEFKMLFKIDNVVFSHAGLLLSFVSRNLPEDRRDNIDQVIDLLNYKGDQGDVIFFEEDSPMWARTILFDHGYYFNEDYVLNVFGHTPTHRVESHEGGLSVDVYSTYRDGHTPIGEQRMIVIDTVTKEWEYA